MLKIYPSSIFATETALNLNPNSINSLDDVLSILKKLGEFESSNKCEAVVALRINKHLGETYIILPKNYVEDSMNKTSGFEWYEKYYSSSYFENLKNKLISKKYENSPKLLC